MILSTKIAKTSLSGIIWWSKSIKEIIISITNKIITNRVS